MFEVATSSCPRHRKYTSFVNIVVFLVLTQKKKRKAKKTAIKMTRKEGDLNCFLQEEDYE